MAEYSSPKKRTYSPAPSEHAKPKDGKSSVNGLRSAVSSKLPMKDPRVKYMGEEDGPFRCDNCTHFKDPNGCSKVQGDIHPAGCCNLFEPKKDKETTNPYPMLRVDNPAPDVVL